jgi:hypothetical protein
MPLRTIHARPRIRRAAPLLAVAALAGGCGGGVEATALAPPSAPAVRPFAPRGVWNGPLPAHVRIARGSPALVAALAREARRERADGTGPWINDTVPLLTVGREQPTVRVQLVGHRPDRALQRAWRAVPLPPDAIPSRGSDHALTVWQPATDRLWEFWRLRRGVGGWQARWGGTMRRVHRNAGSFSPAAWPGARRWWGATATSLPLLGGLIRLGELRGGSIPHALALAVPDTRAGAYCHPAQRTDGVAHDPTSLPEGARLRLDPTLDVGRLGLSPPARAIAQAAQRYGLIVRDTSPNVALYAEEPPPGDGLLGPLPSSGDAQLLARFPWERLEVIACRLRGSR